jgi:acyl carrier protein
MKEKVLKNILFKIKPEIKKYINKKNIHLVNDNILDSFDIMQILLEIEKINNKKFNNNNINRDSFKNIKSILALIKL